MVNLNTKNIKKYRVINILLADFNPIECALAHLLYNNYTVCLCRKCK